MDDTNWEWVEPEPEPEEKRHRGLSGFLIGLAMGAVTLLLVTALVLSAVAYLFWPGEDVLDSLTRNTNRTNTSTQHTTVSRPSPSEAELRAANYRPSEWEPSVITQITTPTAVAPDVVIQADAEYLLLTNIYERVNPSVVNIEIVSRAYSQLDLIDTSGSGFVIDLDGHIVTNSHVVREAEEIVVTFFDGYVTEAELIAYDDYSDLAVIQVDPADIPLVPVEMGDSNELNVGQRVIAIGNPFGLDGSMTVGIVSALGRSLPSAQLLDPAYARYNNPSIIQVDAAVNPGNSGGPLLDSYGRVVGINTAIRTENGGFQGIAFAVPVNTLKRVVPQLIDNGVVKYSWLGISSPTLDRGVTIRVVAEELDLPVQNGVMISEVFEDSPASRAGLMGGTQTTIVRGIEIPVDGDIVVAINGQAVRDIDDLVAYLVENTSPDDVVVLTIVRDRETLDLDVTLDVRP